MHGVGDVEVVGARDDGLNSRRRQRWYGWPTLWHGHALYGVMQHCGEAMASRRVGLVLQWCLNNSRMNTTYAIVCVGCECEDNLTNMLKLLSNGTNKPFDEH